MCGSRPPTKYSTTTKAAADIANPYGYSEME